MNKINANFYDTKWAMPARLQCCPDVPASMVFPELYKIRKLYLNSVFV